MPSTHIKSQAWIHVPETPILEVAVDRWIPEAHKPISLAKMKDST